MSREEAQRMLAPVIERYNMTSVLHPIAERMRVLLMVSKFGHCLNDLLYRHRVGALPVDIPAIVSNHPRLLPARREPRYCRSITSRWRTKPRRSRSTGSPN